MVATVNSHVYDSTSDNFKLCVPSNFSYFLIWDLFFLLNLFEKWLRISIVTDYLAPTKLSKKIKISAMLLTLEALYFLKYIFVCKIINLNFCLGVRYCLLTEEKVWASSFHGARYIPCMHITLVHVFDVFKIMINN